MLIHQKILVSIFFALIFGGAIYFTFNKFKEEISPPVSPSPTPSLNFILTATPSPTAQSQTESAGPQKPYQVQAQSTPKSSELPLLKNKNLGRFPGILSEEELNNKAVTLVTSKGNLVIEIYPDVPKAASNFLLLASNGFYDNLTFHRVEPGLLVQGGDPKGDGTGDGGYIFEDELTDREYVRGTVAMANRGPNTNSTQFFIVIADNPGIPKKYTIFGTIIFGMDVVERIVPKDIIYKAVVQPLR